MPGKISELIEGDAERRGMHGSHLKGYRVKTLPLERKRYLLKSYPLFRESVT